MSNIFNWIGATVIIVLVVFGCYSLSQDMVKQMDKQIQITKDNCASICLHDKGTFDKVDFGSAHTNDVCYCKDAEGNLFTRIM